MYESYCSLICCNNTSNLPRSRSRRGKVGRKLLRRGRWGFWGISLPRLPLLLHISPFPRIPPSLLPSLPPVFSSPASVFLRCTGYVNSTGAFRHLPPAPRGVIEPPQNSNLARNGVELISHTFTRLRGGTHTQKPQTRVCQVSPVR